VSSQNKSRILGANPPHIQNFISLQALSTPTDSSGSAGSREGKFQMYRPTEDARYF